MIEDVGHTIGNGTRRLDSVVERVVRRIFFRKRRTEPTDRAGAVTRGLAFALDVLIVNLGFSGLAAVAALFRETISVGSHRPRWRHLLWMAGVIALLIAMAIMIAVNTVFALVPAAKANQAAVSSILILAMLGIGLVLTARFLLLLPAIAVNETTPALRRAWALSAGNALPLLGVLLGIFLPVALVFVLIDLGLGEKGAVSTGATQQLQMVAAVMQARQTLPLTCGLSFFFSPLVIALFAGASVSAWRTLKDEPVTEIVA